MSGIQVINCDPSAPPNEGETLTVNYLRHQLPHGILLVNYHLPDVTGTLEIDIVAITYYGIFLLEVKHWLGNITVYDDRWLHEFSGEWRDSPLLSIERKAKVLHSFLRNRGWGDVSVVGMVVLSKGTGSVRGVEDLAARRIFGRHESLVHALTSRDYVFSQSSRILSSDHLPQLAQMIFNSHVANAERHVGGYRILEVRPREHYTELVGEDREFPGRRHASNNMIYRKSVPNASWRRRSAASNEIWPHCSTPGLILTWCCPTNSCATRILMSGIT